MIYMKTMWTANTRLGTGRFLVMVRTQRCWCRVLKASGRRGTTSTSWLADTAASCIHYPTWSHQRCHCWRDQKLHQIPNCVFRWTEFKLQVLLKLSSVSYLIIKETNCVMSGLISVPQLPVFLCCRFLSIVRWLLNRLNRILIVP